MSRVRRGFKARRRRNRILKLAKGFQFDRRTKFKHARTTLRRALHFSYISRRLRKRDFRALWVQRINAAVRIHDWSYSKFTAAYKTKGLLLNRKMLAEIAARDSEGFKAIIQAVR